MFYSWERSGLHRIKGAWPLIAEPLLLNRVNINLGQNELF